LVLESQACVMTRADSRIGLAFYTATGRWRCTDVGTRVSTAITLERPDDLSSVFHLGLDRLRRRRRRCATPLCNSIRATGRRATAGATIRAERDCDA